MTIKNNVLTVCEYNIFCIKMYMYHAEYCKHHYNIKETFQLLRAKIKADQEKHKPMFYRQLRNAVYTSYMTCIYLCHFYSVILRSYP